MKYLITAILVVVSFSLLPVCAVAAENQFSVEKVVLVSRHGVRSPTKSNASLADYSPRDWPIWPVAPGELTPHGAKLTEAFGRYLRLSYGNQGLLPAEGCPKTQAVRVWADVDQRTRASGDALLTGMFPDCGLRAEYSHPKADKEPQDQLFHTTICPMDAEVARKAVLETAGGSMEELTSRYRRPLAALQEILHYQPASGCAAGQSACSLDTMPNSLKVGSKGGDISMVGPLAIASTVSEIFLLEYAEGLPVADVGWGKVAVPSQLSDLLVLHNLKFDLLARPKYIASHHGTLLLEQVMTALNHGADPRNDGAPEHLVAFIGHDTNLANLAGMLDLKWHSNEQPDNAAPGATFAFELLKEKQSGQYFVRTFLYIQTLEQMHKGSPLDIEHPPIKIALVVSGCDGGETNLCSLKRFSAVVERVLDKDCLKQAKDIGVESYSRSSTEVTGHMPITGRASESP